MSHSGEEEEDSECYYESFDRLLSTPSIPSSSSDEDDHEHNLNSPNYASDHISIPKFPMAVSTYDIWISEPSSVEERRKRLLREMGLISDSRFLKSNRSSEESCSGGVPESGRSASSDQIRSRQSTQAENSDSSAIGRFKSDNAADFNSSSYDHCNSSISSPSIHSINSIKSVANETETRPLVNSPYLLSKSRSNGCNESPIANVASSPNKPPSGRPSRRSEEIRRDSTNTNTNPNSNSSPVLANASGGEFDDNLRCNEVVTAPDRFCKIKNLDNGKEFVVNDFREDGMWTKLREIGTGRQLTMEEFEMCSGRSPIVQELMRRQNVEQLNCKKDDMGLNGNGSNGGVMKSKKSSWFKSIKSVANTVTGFRDWRSSDERDTSSEKGGRRSSSATDDSQDVSFHGSERVKVRQYGKPCKELTALYKNQEIQAHNGSIWSIKFSLDGRYLASAGEDCVILIWQVLESERKDDLMEKQEDGNSNIYFAANGSPEVTLVLPNVDNPLEKKRRGRTSISHKPISLEHIMMPESVFALSEKPICSFQGHLDDVLDLSWSKSQYLLSSSMDKTVRMWHMASNCCLKVFSHSDYVTCIQFNPVDDRYFISGSLDAKVRIWSIPDRQVVDWNDLHEMVTAACYTPDGQSALVGSYKGSCCLYNTSENKLHQKSQINLQNKKKKSHHKKITGFQFAPGNSSEVLITSADSRIRVIDGIDLVHKFKGFRNTSSQISASLTANGKYVVSASGDSYVYIWNHDGDSQPSRNRGVTSTGSYETFHCQDVSVAIPWPGMAGIEGMQDSYSEEHSELSNLQDEVSAVNNTPLLVEASGQEGSPPMYGCTTSRKHGTLSSVNSSYFFDRMSATWPEEKLLLASRDQSPQGSVDFSNGVKQGGSAWGMVIVTAGLRGEIKTFQNFGLPVRI